MLIEFFRTHFDRGVLNGSASRSQRHNEDASNNDRSGIAANNGAANIDPSASSCQLRFSREDTYYVPHESRPRKYAFWLPSDAAWRFRAERCGDIHASRKQSRIVLDEQSAASIRRTTIAAGIRRSIGARSHKPGSYQSPHVCRPFSRRRSSPPGRRVVRSPTAQAPRQQPTGASPIGIYGR